MPEKRRLKRKHLIYYLKVHDAKTNQVIGRVQDMHIEGMMLTSAKPLPTGATFHLKIDLPSEILGKKQLAVEARSMWNKRDVNPDYYDTGLKLSKMSEDDTKVIKRLTQRYRFRD